MIAQCNSSATAKPPHEQSKLARASRSSFLLVAVRFGAGALHRAPPSAPDKRAVPPV